ncbi:hypothetical protein Q3G72_020452 [Acer saccharum]|nr:hypothetical protein Q3G72_020452 [Acer saccharum]
MEPQGPWTCSHCVCLSFLSAGFPTLSWSLYFPPYCKPLKYTVAKAPSYFERILQPHVPVIMEVCMINATEVEKPHSYLQLLRTMFRALPGCKF